MIPAALLLLAAAQLRAGAAEVNVTPEKFPVVVNGMFEERSAARAGVPLSSRALVLEGGGTRLAIVVVDSLMMTRAFLDEVKQRAARDTGIPVDRLLISATHTHSAPSVMGCLGSGVDPEYGKQLGDGIVRSIVRAAGRMEPAEVGWAVVADTKHNHCRRWIFRPDKIGTDPFGGKTMRAHMHPGHQSPNHVGPSGPADTDLSLLAVRGAAGGKPIAVVANYAMHYKGSEPVSGDVCGLFGPTLRAAIGAEPGFVAMLSQGTSGDSMWMDYSAPRNDPGLERYTAELVEVARGALAKVEYRDRAVVAMEETRLKLRRRVPDEERLAWARRVFPHPLERTPRGMKEVYAREALLLHADPEAELTLQAVRIGELGIVAIPNEVYGITGLKIKESSPLRPTFVIELANGAEGYIPPPEQHALGGYTTWPARTAGLEVEAEPKIVEALLGALERASGGERRPPVTGGMDELTWDRERFEKGVAFGLPGVKGRAVHFAGGRMRETRPGLGEEYSVTLSIWNGLPNDARPVTGYFFSRGADGAEGAPGLHLGIGGTSDPALTGRLIVFNGNRLNAILAGKIVIEPKRWYTVGLKRQGRRVTVDLDGAREIDGEIESGHAAGEPQLFVGGRSDNFANFEGRIDEVMIGR